MTFHERVDAVTRLRFTSRQAQFLVTVALHSGYCLRRQYEALAGIRYGKNVRAFLDGLVTRGIAERFTARADRGHVYHVHSRALYRLIGEPESRNRRSVSAAYIARKLMLLDVVIARPDVRWFATDEEKVDLFVNTFGVPHAALPRRTPGASAGDAEAARYFVHNLPIFVPADGQTAHFVYLATDGNPDPFSAFLREHAPLVRSLATWTVVVAGVAHGPELQVAFNRFVDSLSLTLPAAHDELRWYFERRCLVERGDLAQVSVFDLRRYRDVRQRLNSPMHDALYADWLKTGGLAAATPPSPAGESTGSLRIEPLPFAYEQFGSLPGVA